MMELDRKTRSKSSSHIDFFNPHFDVRGRVNYPNQEMNKFGALVQGYEGQLKRKFKREPRILRWIKELQIDPDNSWKNN